MTKTPATIRLLREIRAKYEAGEGPHPLASWANNWGNSLGVDPMDMNSPQLLRKDISRAAKEHDWLVYNGNRTSIFIHPQTRDTIIVVWTKPQPDKNWVKFVGAESFNKDGKFLAGTLDSFVARNWLTDAR